VTSPAFRPVENFEAAMAEFTGSRYAVAMESGSAAIFLSCVLCAVKDVTIPARTYISVPAAIIHAGGIVHFEDYAWSGAYPLLPYGITDSALRLRQGMYTNGLVCLSFHMRKLLPIGRGGMVLTDDAAAADRLRKMRFDGRDGSTPFMQDQVALLGWNMYMLPEQAARGLQLLEGLRPDLPDLEPDYPDLREMPVFRGLTDSV
jgi:dTDP-4-amino-4,6-dideoxygalactose transaminase